MARFGISGWVTTWAYAGFPWGTFLVNVLGSAVLGLVSSGFSRALASPHTRAFLALGVCGGFTTFSTFDFETLALLQRREFAAALLYSFGSVCVCIAGVHAGMRLGDALKNPAAETSIG